MTIHISRQYGSGGSEIGKKLAEYLSVPFYDLELLALRMMQNRKSSQTDDQKDELAMDQCEQYGELLDAVVHNLADGQHIDKELIAIENELVNDLRQNPCVLVGHFIGGVSNPDIPFLKVFVYADRIARMERLVDKYGLTLGRASRYLAVEEIHRIHTYESYSETKWDDLTPYDLTINTTSKGIEFAVEQIRSAVSYYGNSMLTVAGQAAI
jgi:cytidylate kinase